MAVNNPSGLTITNPQTGIQYTKVTDSSADWSSVANSTYFYDITDKIIYFKNSSGIVLSLFANNNGTSNYLAKFNSTTTLTNSLIQDNGTNVSINSAIEAFTLLTIKNSNLTTTLSSENTKSLSGSSPKNYAIIGTANCDGFASGGVSQGAIGVAGFANNNNVGSNGTAIGGYFEAQATTANRYAIQLVDGTQAVGKFLKSITSDGRANWASITSADITGLLSGSGTTNYIPLWTGTSALGNSLIQQQTTGGFNGIGIGNAPDSNVKLFIDSSDKVFPFTVNNQFIGSSTISIIGQSFGVNSQINIGIKGESWNSTTENIGVQGFANEVTVGNNTGGYFQALNGVNNYALKLQDGTEASNKFLKSVDSLGNANWSTIDASNIYGGNSGDVLTSNGGSSAASWQPASGGSASWSEWIQNVDSFNTYRGISINNNSTSLIVDGGITTGGSYSSLAQSVAVTTFQTMQVRIRIYASVVSTGRYSNIRGSSLLWGTSSGFRFVCVAGISDTVYAAGCQNFFGLANSTSDLGIGGVSLVQVSTLLNFIAFANDGADANMQFMHNDATGTATKIDLGASFPANRTSGAAMTTMYTMIIQKLNANSNVYYWIKNNETGATASGSVNTNLPSTATLLNFHAGRAMNSPVTNTGQFDLSKLGVYSIL